MTRDLDALRQAMNATPEQRERLVEVAEDLAPTSREFLLVQGGSPAALTLAAQLDDPEVRARLEGQFQQLAAWANRAVEDLVRALAPAMTEFGRQLNDMYGKLREAGILPEEPPGDPRARALWLRQHRGTGPDRQVQHRPRPRSIRQ